MRVLFASNAQNAFKFTKWSTETLFVAHLGTEEQKNTLSSKLLGVDAKTAKEVFNKTTSMLPCIYLFTLGKVKNLKKSFNFKDKYADDCIVAKIGLTKDIDRRIGEHTNELGCKEGVKLHLKMYNYIDPQYLYDAETQLKSLMKDLGYMLSGNEKYKELIVYEKENFKKIKDIYQMLSDKFIGHVKEMQLHIKDLENKNVILQKDNTIQQKNQEIKTKDDIIKLMEAELKIKELEYENRVLKHKLAKYKE